MREETTEVNVHAGIGTIAVGSQHLRSVTAVTLFMFSILI